jgi:hypothetical protein
MGIRRAAMASWVLSLAFTGTASAAAGDELEIRALSNRADLISGGDALVDVRLPSGVDPAEVRVAVDGRNVTSAFAMRPDGRFGALLTGLKDGPNVVTAQAPGLSDVKLTLESHPIGGPVFSGPQTQPWLCTTEAHELGKATDAQCNAPTKIAYLYKPTVGTGLQPYDPASPPSDVANTTTDQGKTVPFIVRRERGVINRGIYEIAVLTNPKDEWTPWSPQRAWNRKLYWTFGGDCKPNHSQPADTALNENVLGKGWAVAASGMTVLGTDCNSVVVGETVMMIKERIAERYGPIRYTMSEGCSGGSMQQHWLVSNYPGLLDGIQPQCSYPDIWETMQEAEDCHVLDHYFLEVSPHLWASTTQQNAVTGYAEQTTCHSAWDGPSPAGYAQNWLDPDNAPACSLPAEQVYNATTNRTGARCTLPDYMVSIFGHRASDGFANRPYDNVGVQYGLGALNSGVITAEQFVDLNEKVGGIDIDWNYQAARSAADREALEVAYRAGLVTYPREAAKVPIIDLRGSSNYEIHTDFHSYTMRDRLNDANGNHANQIIWTDPMSLAGDPIKTQQSFVLLDKWLSRIEADKSDRSRAEKVRADKPAEAIDACWIGGQKITDMQKCRAAFPYYADPRIVAGAALADNVLKCQLKPLDRGDYVATFSDDQWARLSKAFPGGVCDYNQPGVAQQPSIPWMTFADGPGGRPLGSVPRSVALAPVTGGRVIGLPSARRCLSRRQIRLRLRAPHGERLGTVRLSVNGRRTRTLRGRGRTRLRAMVDLGGLPHGTVHVRVVARTLSGRTVVKKRDYRTCTPRRHA